MDAFVAGWSKELHSKERLHFTHTYIRDPYDRRKYLNTVY